VKQKTMAQNLNVRSYDPSSYDGCNYSVGCSCTQLRDDLRVYCLSSTFLNLFSYNTQLRDDLRVYCLSSAFLNLFLTISWYDKR